MQNNKIKKFISFYEFIMKEIISKDGLLIFISYIQSNIISHEHCIKMVGGGWYLIGRLLCMKSLKKQCVVKEISQIEPPVWCVEHNSQPTLQWDNKRDDLSGISLQGMG